MIPKYHKLALTASIALAMAFIFSCSSDTNDDTKPSSNSGGGTSSPSTGGSSSSGAAQGGVGSCVVPVGLCYENVPQNRCSRNDGTFSAAACGATYTYCVSGYPDNCDLIGSTGMLSKASCPADKDGIKVFANETLCGGTKGSCVIQIQEGLYDGQYTLCIDVNRGICENIYAESLSQPTTFKTGECSTSSDYPCCFFGDGTAKSFMTEFDKSDCYAERGTPASAGICLAADYRETQ